MSKLPLTCLSTSGSKSRRYCWKCWGKEANVCLLINALKLVLTRIDPGVSMSMSSALVHFKCPVIKSKRHEFTTDWKHHARVHTDICIYRAYIYTHIDSWIYLILPLLKMVFQKEISKASLCSYLPKLSLIFIMHTSLNVSIFLSQRSPVLDKEVLYGLPIHQNF